MPAQLNGLLGRARTTISQFTLAQRTIALIGLGVLVLGAVALSSWLTTASMTPLFANLSATDASAIVDQLDGQGVEYELADGGSTILVPADEVYSLRLQVASAGLPTDSDGGGYSLLDSMGMTSSEFQQQVTYQRAIEGELAKTISAINGVRGATVHLALPEDSVFVSETPEATASVFVETSPGSTLSADQVQAIVHLVSAGIEGMSPEDVAVIDANGQVLSAVGSSSVGGLQGSQVSDYEARVAANVQNMLNSVLGPGNAVVSVTAELDFDEASRTSETYSATADLPPSSASTTTETYSGTGSTVGGVLGTDGTVTNPASGEDAGDYRREDSTVNNPINRVTEELISAPGTVRRQSVSVIVSDTTDVDVTSLQNSIAAAAGIDTERGDIVEVSQMAFDTTAATQAQEAIAAADEAAKAERTTELIKTGAIATVVLISVILLIVMGLRRRKSDTREAVDLGDLELLEAARALSIEAGEKAEAARALPVAEPVQQAGPSRRDEVMAMAAEQPAEVAEVLRGWLSSGRA
jgi:flagellar M-ring protein FliF